MAMVCNLVQLPELRICDHEGLTNVILAQPAFIPQRDEEKGYGPSRADLGGVESFVDDCLTAVTAAKREHNLVVFPEAFIPSSRVSRLIDFVRSDCPQNTVIIAGIESLPVQSVLESEIFYFDETIRENLIAARKPHHRFVNACLILVRDREGYSHEYVQLKMKPSHAEQSLRAMLTGEKVYFFTCPQLSFGVLICSDFIDRSSGNWLPVEVIDALEEAWNAGKPSTPLAIDLLVNIQCNPKPNHRSFREAAKGVLYARKDSVRLDQTFILISNWGGLWDGQEPILSSAIVYQAQFWQPPPGYDANVPRGYSLTRDMIVDNLNIAAFRSSEQGRCRFRMSPCSRADMSDPSRRLPLKDCYFELKDESGEWHIQEKSAWHDRCDRWLPLSIPNSPYAGFWSMPNSQGMQSDVHAKYHETRKSILDKTANDLRQDCLCLMLSLANANNPDMWGPQQKVALNKWASIATLFHYEDPNLNFGGDEWYSFRWREKICIAIIDGQDLISCDRSLEGYQKHFGRKLPQDPKLNSVVLVILYRHTRDKRQAVRQITPLFTESWYHPDRSPEGVRAEALTRNAEDVTRSRPSHRLFWCTAGDFDIAWDADGMERLHNEMEKICEPALD